MKKCLSLFFKFFLLCFYIIDIFILLIYLLSVFTQYGLKAGLSMLLFNPANSSFFILLYAIFVSGTFMIYKNFRSNKKKDFNIKNMHNKYKIEKVIVMGLIVFFYIIDIPTIIVFSFFLIEEIRELNVPNALPSSLNIGIESMVLYWIICIIPFIVITVLIVKNNKKKR